MKILEKQKAAELRKIGHSIKEIAYELGVSQSSVSSWVKGIEIGFLGVNRIKERQKNAREKSSKTLHERKLKRLDEVSLHTDELLRNISPNVNNFVIALSVMYWCEGAKSDRYVAFTNSDPLMVRCFINMFLKVFSADRSKIKIRVHLHDYHNKEETLNFWSKAIDIPIAQFSKPYIKQSNHTFKKDGYMGCVRVIYYSTHIARVLLSVAKKSINLYI